MGKSTYNALIGIGLVIFIVFLILTCASGYALWRDFRSAGIYSFTSTGEVWVKEEREKTGRKRSKIVNRPYAAFISEGGGYYTEERISSAMKTRIQKGSQYTVKREVFVDRLGEYKVTLPDKEQTNEKYKWRVVIPFGLVSFLGGVLMYFAFRTKRRRFGSV